MIFRTAMRNRSHVFGVLAASLFVLILGCGGGGGGSSTNSTTGATNATTNATTTGDPAATIVFQSDQFGVKRDVFSMNLDGSSKTNLTDSETTDSLRPCFSANGQLIAFVSSKSGISQIWTMNADGSNKAMIPTVGLPLRDVSISPDGTRFAISAYDGNDQEIYVLDLDGSDLQKLTDNNLQDQDPVWKPDGTLIAFEQERPSGGSDIWTITPAGLSLTNLTNVSTTDLRQEPAWSPDGLKIAFAGEVTGHRHVFIMDADGSNQVQLTSGITPHEGQHPCFTPDGTKIVYSWRVTGSQYDIWIMNANGSNQTPLTNDSAEDREPNLRLLP